jgi:PTH1 family peptidyl-tRNA hydrolase
MSSWLIVGLGNPGEQYRLTRHNLGFMLIDKLADEAQVAVNRRECNAFVGAGKLEGTRVKLVKPQTFMNLSGEAVSCFLRRGDIEHSARQLLVISDDLALPLGKIRLRERGSAGGHNGLKSVIAALGTNEFIRLRMGIQPLHPISDARRFVLDSFARSERVLVEESLELAAKAVKCVLKDGVLVAMSRFN